MLGIWTRTYRIGFKGGWYGSLMCFDKVLTLPTAKAGGILASTTTALADTIRYLNVLHSVHKLDYTVPVCPTVQFIGSIVLCLLCWLHLQSFIQYVDTCVGIPIMLCMALRTLPFTDCKILYKWIFKSTTGTCLAAWVHCRHFYNVIPIPNRFIGQHIKKLRPRCRTYMLC